MPERVRRGGRRTEARLDYTPLLQEAHRIRVFSRLPGAAQQPAPDPSLQGRQGRWPRALPAPILAAFKAAYPHASIKSAAEEKENGKLVWEVESTQDGLGRDLLYTPDGSVVEIEEEVPSAQLPAPVTAAVKAQFPAARIVKAERVTRSGTVSYELHLAGAGKEVDRADPGGEARRFEVVSGGRRDSGLQALRARADHDRVV